MILIMFVISTDRWS